jgi:hypothetical protein
VEEMRCRRQDTAKNVENTENATEKNVHEKAPSSYCKELESVPSTRAGALG